MRPIVNGPIQPDVESVAAHLLDPARWTAPSIPTQPPPPDRESIRAAGTAALERWEARMTGPADIDDEPLPLEAEPVHPWPRADWQMQPLDVRVGRCDSVRPVTGAVPGQLDVIRFGARGVRCSLRFGHQTPHRFPPIMIRSRYGIIRALCHLCDWSTEVDATDYLYTSWARISAERSASNHLRNVHR